MKRLLALACLLLAPSAWATDTVVYITNTATTSWTVPVDWNNSANTMECIGPGGDGGTPVAATKSSGGGGSGGYSKTTNTTYTIGNVITVAVTDHGSVGSTLVKNNTNGSNVLVCKGGGNASGASLGSAAAAGTGNVTAAAGCHGGAGLTNAAARPGGGGAGAPGPSGVCGIGGSATATTSGVGGDADNSAATGGASVTVTNGNPGSMAATWDASYGACSGPSGGGILPGNGGVNPVPCYGNGGAGAADAAATVGTPSNGGQGIIRISYTPANNLAPLGMMGVGK